MTILFRRSPRLVAFVLVPVLASVVFGTPALAQEPSDAPTTSPPARDWAGTLRGATQLLMLEHSVRIAAEDKTRRELGGPFLSDYVRSLHWPRQWRDGDGWRVNYVGHPVHGAAAGRIWLEFRAVDPPFGLNAAYFRSRAEAALFAGAYSLQFEVGPLSEASIGNVGRRPGTAGWTDLVMTPLGAFGVLLGEDMVARYVLPWVERRTSNRVVRAVARMTLNPGKGMANISQRRVPWAQPAAAR